MSIRPMTPEEKFEIARFAYGEILLANSRAWKGCRSLLQKQGMQKVLNDIKAATKEMEETLELMSSQPVRPISEEAYEAKVAAGKKITNSPEQGHSPLKQED